MKTIEVRYKCSCMSAEESFQVRERREGEDIKHWLDEALNPALFVDHRRRSPRCRAAKTEYVKIPMDEGKPIGAKPETKH